MYQFKIGDLCWNNSDRTYICMILEDHGDADGYIKTRVIAISNSSLASSKWIGMICRLGYPIPINAP